jgi:preprotein translocase subunit YajC
VQELASLLPIIGIALLFWFLIIRPQSKRQRAVRQMQSQLQVGQEVMLTSGMFGTIEQINDEDLDLRIADGVTVKVAKGAVANVVDRSMNRPEDNPEQLPPTHE